MKHIAAIGIFCGASSGHDPNYIEMAALVGRQLATQKIDIVYGGGHIGLMGAVADGALASGGRVIGVMPHALIAREVQHTGLTKLHAVETMHARKLKMTDLSDAFLALPGGVGTLEEIFEQWTWAQLGIHRKPCVFLNIDGFWDPLRDMIARIVAKGFMRQPHADMAPFLDTLGDALAYFHGYEPPEIKWQ